MYKGTEYVNAYYRRRGKFILDLFVENCRSSECTLKSEVLNANLIVARQYERTEKVSYQKICSAV